MGIVSCQQETKKEDTTIISKPEDNSGKLEKEEHVTYYPNGVKKLQGTLVDGDKEGTWSSYFENGYTQSTKAYIHNKLYGMSFVYHKNGQVFYKGKYKNDLQVGEWLFYDSLGNPVKKVVYDELGNKTNEISLK